VKKPPTPILITIGVIVALCCGCSVLVGMFGDDKPKSTKQVTAPAVPTFSAPTVAPIPSPSPSPSPVPVQMPNVTGQNAAIAQDTLKKAGFTNVTLGSADPQDKFVILAQNWTVKEQSTAAGQTIPSDTLVVLTCTKKR
jgi:hypothetical protein